MRRIVLGGAVVDLCSRQNAFRIIGERLVSGPFLAVASANLDHVHHFGTRGESRSIITPATTDWLVLLDGMPLVWTARRLTGQPWTQVAGSEELPGLLALAANHGARVGFLGGRSAMHERLRVALEERYPTLNTVGYWSPSRLELADAGSAARLEREIRDAAVDLLVVSLGKPRQEEWISRHGPATGARVCLAFGAAADFVSGEVRRAPRLMRQMGFEWLYRLILEPRRLARRYLQYGPVAAYHLITKSHMGSPI